jgi:hypothetical protein
MVDDALETRPHGLTRLEVHLKRRNTDRERKRAGEKEGA